MKEKISALVDGELEGKAAEEAIDALRRGGEGFDAWRTYQLIGDSLRDTPPLSDGFAQRFSARLGEEPAVLAPGRLRSAPRNWLAVPAAAAASLAAVGLVGWLAFGPQPGQAPRPELAQTQAPVLPAVAELRPARIPLPLATPDYLLAHQGFSPRVSLQGMAPYARTVSDEANEARR
jgi:negative regulator of sigma E activity